MVRLASHRAGVIVEGLAAAAHAAGDYAASAGFGSTATVTPTATDVGGRVSVASSGTGQGANPTLTLTFKDGAFENAPIVVCARGDTAAAAGDWRVTSITTTAVVFTFVGTPVAAQTYILEFAVKAA